MPEASSVRSPWLFDSIERYGADKDKVCYERQMALTEVKGLTQERECSVHPNHAREQLDPLMGL